MKVTNLTVQSLTKTLVSSYKGCSDAPRCCTRPTHAAQKGLIYSPHQKLCFYPSKEHGDVVPKDEQHAGYSQKRAPNFSC